ncbi:glucosaminidase domain-containing protein [Zunongwangia profunda]|uniref:glucosaminidase domain-containing protein n=1 Tax=Zunongwangia profunda TaxID=398743 RepID=UPI001D1971FC|nr:glucosaminidase domain-containing protein [Zunongwangia profunda]MCC4229729.1 glucosaminidase domain-containing protein [Zunongwangia profunda]
MRLKPYLVLIVFALFMASCGSKKKVTTRKNRKDRNEAVINNRNQANRNSETPAEVVDAETMPVRTYDFTVENYIADYAPVAQHEMRLYRVPASITLAQGILESGSGKGRLAQQANNHFGIKCHDWQGEKIYHDDDRNQECFRKYKHPKYSFRDHSLFLAERRRYAGLFDLDQDDYKGWAKGLRQAGYATDRRYPQKLIELIERYELYRYDADVLERPSPSYTTTFEAKGDSYIVKKGDTLYSISKRYNTSVEEIKRLNNLNGTNIDIGQTLLVKERR